MCLFSIALKIYQVIGIAPIVRAQAIAVQTVLEIKENHVESIPGKTILKLDPCVALALRTIVVTHHIIILPMIRILLFVV